MSDQNRFDQLKQKLLHYWTLFIAACGRGWGTVKTYAGKTGSFLLRCGKNFVQMLRVLFAKIWVLLVRMWSGIQRFVRRVIQILAAWVLGIGRKIRSGFMKMKEWLSVRFARERQTKPAETEKKDRAEEPEQTPAVSDAEIEAVAQAAAADLFNEEPVQKAGRKPRTNNPTLLKIYEVLGIIGKYALLTIQWIWKLRTVIMAIPVLWTAVKLARENMVRLPETVGLDIQASGEFARMITRNQAVYWPLGITVFCLVLMFCSKKPMLPWAISIFTLVLPWLIWMLNYYA